MSNRRFANVQQQLRQKSNWPVVTEATLVHASRIASRIFRIQVLKRSKSSRLRFCRQLAAAAILSLLPVGATECPASYPLYMARFTEPT